MAETMKAVVYHEYGSLDVLKYVETERPTPGEGDVLIQVRAVSLNRSDWEGISGTPLYSRIFGLFRPRHSVLGSDVTGTVVAVGKNVTRFVPGDEVYGDTLGTFGGLAEFACAPEKVLFKKPSDLSFEDISTIPQAGIIALQGLEWGGGVKQGERVLINGAGGGSGMFAVQMAKLRGAHVAAIDNERKLDHMRALGADQVFGYETYDFTRSSEVYDHILDLVATRSAFAHKRALAPGGRYAVVGGSVGTLLDNLIFGKILGTFSGRRIGVLAAEAREADFLRVMEMVRSQQIRITIDKVFPLEEAVEALRYMGEGHARGKVVVRVS